MSLYFAYTKGLEKRQAKNIFFTKNGGCFRYNKRKDKLIYNFPEINAETIDAIFDYASKRKIDTYELMLSESISSSKFNDLISVISKYLIDKDLSIGLLTEDKSFYDANQDKVRSYGVATMSNTFIREQKELRRRFSLAPDAAPKEAKVRFSKSAGRLNFVLSEEKAQPISKRDISNKDRIILDESFHDKLFRLLNECGKENSEVYSRGGITKQVFSKAISNTNSVPSKPTIICLIIGMELPYSDANELLKSAGYTLSRSMMFDAIVDKYLRKGIYDLFIINDDLYEHECPLLGWKPRNI